MSRKMHVTAILGGHSLHCCACEPRLRFVASYMHVLTAATPRVRATSPLLGVCGNACLLVREPSQAQAKPSHVAWLGLCVCVCGLA